MNFLDDFHVHRVDIERNEENNHSKLKHSRDTFIQFVVIVVVVVVVVVAVNVTAAIDTIIVVLFYFFRLQSVFGRVKAGRNLKSFQNVLRRSYSHDGLRTVS